SDETGRPEVYVQSFPAGGGKWRISSDGGIWPRWSGDGGELFFLSSSAHVKAVEITYRPAPEFGEVRSLFALLHEYGNIANRPFVVSRDGRRFLVRTFTEPAAGRELTVVLKWAQGLN
ncbi:MAG: hypothetical protein ACRD44_00575, partial [Bryobacteraceae bacterium]